MATAPGPDGESETLGIVRTITAPDNSAAEFSMVIRSDLKGQGLGRQLLEKMFRYCKERGTREIVGQVLPDNRDMMRLMRKLGFTARIVPEEDVYEVRRPL